MSAAAAFAPRAEKHQSILMSRKGAESGENACIEKKKNNVKRRRKKKKEEETGETATADNHLIITSEGDASPVKSSERAATFSSHLSPLRFLTCAGLHAEKRRTRRQGKEQAGMDQWKWKTSMYLTPAGQALGR